MTLTFYDVYIVSCVLTLFVLFVRATIQNIRLQKKCEKLEEENKALWRMPHHKHYVDEYLNTK